ncbi:MAG: hypothetical protein KDH09_17705 [Chrysiogenetes bacterium]|nr:hypothetical protein [Chrysiogenetes bacterium]
MEFSAHASLIAAGLCSALAVAVIVRRQQHPTHRAFLLFTVALAAWNLGYFAYLLTWRPLVLRYLLFSSFWIPPAAIHLMRRFFYEEAPALAEARKISLVASIGLCIFALILPNKPMPVLGAGALNVLIFFSQIYLSATILYCAYMLHRQCDLETRAVQKIRIRYLRNGMIVVVAALLAEALWVKLGISFDKPRITAIALTCYLYFVYLSILDYRLLEMQEILGRTVLLGIAGGILSVLHVVLVKLSGDSLAAGVLYIFIASLALLVLYRPVRGYLERKIESVFFGNTYEIKEIAQILGQRMLKTHRPEELIELMLKEFSRLMRVTDVCAYIWNHRLGKYVFAGARGSQIAELPDTLSADPIITALSERGAPLIRDDLESLAERDIGADKRKQVHDLLAAMETLNVELLVPLLGAEGCIGFFGFQDERALEGYAQSEVRAFVSVANTASILLENFRANEELGERERLASMGEMAAGLAHEIRNPLGSIKGAVQYLEDEVEVSGNAREFFDVIIEETDRLSSVVEEFLDYSRKPVLRTKPVDLSDLSARILRQMELEKSDPEVKIHAELPEGLPMALADPNRIKQVLINLVQNAASVLSEGGNVWVRTGADPAGAWVWFSVTDDGPGMDEETRSHIFTPFFTTRERGSGLGLSICHRIIEGHGGSMDVRSAPGEGSEFRVRLRAAPVVLAPDAEGAEVIAHPSAAAQKA